MVLRIFSFFILIIYCTSCEFLTNNKNKTTQEIDTIINFSKVDVSPSFSVCDSLIDIEKSNCFRKTIHEKLMKNLSRYSIKVNGSINQIITVRLLIYSDGKIALKKTTYSKKIKIKIPNLDSLLQLSIDNLPKLYPAIKRGIPVTTEYKLPIHLQIKD